MKIEVELPEEQVACIDRVAALTDTDRPGAISRALGQLLDEVNVNGLFALEGDRVWYSNWREMLAGR